MTSPSFTQEVEAFLTAFFPEDTPLPWSQIAAGHLPQNTAAALMPWLEGLAREPQGISVLPRPGAAGTTWYGVAHSFAQAERLQEDLLAFVGPTYSDFTGARAALDLGDPVEAALARFTGGYAVRLRVPRECQDDARRSLEQLRSLWQARPQRAPGLPRQTGRILRDYHLAIAIGDLEEASLRIDELRKNGRLDAQNLLFLEVRRLAAGSLWNEILDLPQVRDLAQIRCPVLVAEALLCAVYNRDFGGAATFQDPGSVLAHFSERVLPRWPSLFRVKSTMTAPSALRMMMMFAVSTSPQRTEVRDAILRERSLPDGDRAFCEALATHSAPHTSPTVVTSLQLAQAKLASLDFDAAFGVLSQLSPSVEQLALLLQCAVELQSLAATTAVLEAISAVSPIDRDQLLASHRSRVLLDHLVGVTVPGAALPPETVPANWVEWLQRLNRSGPWPKALEVAEHGAREWAAEGLLGDYRVAEDFRALLVDSTKRDAAAQGVVRNALPHLITSLLRDPEYRSRAAGLLTDILLVLTDEAECRAVDLAAIREVIGALIELGPPAGEYRQLVAFLEDTWDKFGSPRTIDWLLDALEILVLSPAPAPDGPHALLARALESFTRWRGRATSAQWALLEVLCRELRADEAYRALTPPEPAVSGDTTSADLRGLTVGIYSLLERPTRHAREALETMFPGVIVQQNADLVATDRLRELARRADILIVVTGAATHAATACIDSARPKSLPLLRPRSRSAAAILAELTTFLERR